MVEIPHCAISVQLINAEILAIMIPIRRYLNSSTQTIYMRVGFGFKINFSSVNKSLIGLCSLAGAPYKFTSSVRVFWHFYQEIVA